MIRRYLELTMPGAEMERLLIADSRNSRWRLANFWNWPEVYKRRAFRGVKARWSG